MEIQNIRRTHLKQLREVFDEVDLPVPDEDDGEDVGEGAEEDDHGQDVALAPQHRVPRRVAGHFFSFLNSSVSFIALFFQTLNEFLAINSFSTILLRMVDLYFLTVLVCLCP